MRFRTPEALESACFAIALLFAALAVVPSIEGAHGAHEDLTVLLTALLLLVFAAELFLNQTVDVVVASTVHFFVVLALVALLDDRQLLLQTIAVCTFIANASLRFGSRIAAQSSAAVMLGELILDHRLLLDGEVRFLLHAVAQISLVLGFHALVRYRENWVRISRELAHCVASLRNSAAANESFIKHITEVREESASNERMRITRELHDLLGYAMTNIGMMMTAAPYLMNKDPAKLASYCKMTKELATNAMDETRRTLYRLRQIRSEVPSEPAIYFDRLCRSFAAATSVSVDCNTGNLPHAISERVFHVLFRSMQVGLTNALRHAHARRIRVSFWLTRQALSLTIWNSVDSTRTYRAPAREGIGLSGVRERLAELGGSLAAEPTKDGFRLVILIPAEEVLRGSN